MGGASLFFARKPAAVEVLNDLNGDLVNLFRCLQDPKTFPELQHRIRYTLYSRAEFGRAIDILNGDETDPVLRAWAMFVAANQSFAGKYDVIGNWGKAIHESARGIAAENNKWIMRLSMLEDWHRRLLMVQIDNRDALEVIRYYDNLDAVFYLDPPHHPDTWDVSQGYDHVADASHHEQLVELILQCKGTVVLSGYDHPIYQSLIENGWTVTTYETVAYAAGRVRGSGLQGAGAAMAKVPRIECIWSNPRAQEMLAAQRGMLPLGEMGNGEN
jgi:DNA adenine methylase